MLHKLKLTCIKNSHHECFHWQVAGFAFHQIHVKDVPVKSSAIVHMNQPWDAEDKEEYQHVVDFYVNQAEKSNYFHKYR